MDKLTVGASHVAGDITKAFEGCSTDASEWHIVLVDVRKCHVSPGPLISIAETAHQALVEFRHC